MKLIIIILILILLLLIINNRKNKEHLKIVSYKNIAKKGSVKGKVTNLGKQIFLVAGGLIQGIFDTGELAKYLIVDVPKDILKVVDSKPAKNDPFVNIFDIDGEYNSPMEEEGLLPEELLLKKVLNNKEIQKQIEKMAKSEKKSSKKLKLINDKSKKASKTTKNYKKNKINYSTYKQQMESYGFVL